MKGNGVVCGVVSGLHNIPLPHQVQMLTLAPFLCPSRLHSVLETNWDQHICNIFNCLKYIDLHFVSYSKDKYFCSYRSSKHREFLDSTRKGFVVMTLVYSLCKKPIHHCLKTNTSKHRVKSVLENSYIISWCKLSISVWGQCSHLWQNIWECSHKQICVTID